MYARYTFSLVLVSCMFASVFAKPTYSANTVGTAGSLDKRQDIPALDQVDAASVLSRGYQVGTMKKARQTEDVADADPDLTAMPASEAVDGIETEDDAQAESADTGAEAQTDGDDESTAVSASKRDQVTDAKEFLVKRQDVESESADTTADSTDQVDGAADGTDGSDTTSDVDDSSAVDTDSADSADAVETGAESDNDTAAEETATDAVEA